jgi:hypothetical protein
LTATIVRTCWAGSAKVQFTESKLTSHQHIPPEATCVQQHLSTTTRHPCFRYHFAFYCPFHRIHLLPLTSDIGTGVLMIPSTWQVMSEKQSYLMDGGRGNWLESDFNWMTFTRKRVRIDCIPFWRCLLDALQGNSKYLPTISSVLADRERVHQKCCDHILACSRVGIRVCADEQAR